MKDYQVFPKYAYDASRRVLPTAYVANLTVPLNRTLVIVPSAAETWLFQVDRCRVFTITKLELIFPNRLFRV